MSPESYFDLVADPDLEAVELERMDVLLPGNAFPEENENHRLSDDCVRRLLINRKKPVDSTCHYHQPIIDEYEEFMAACDQALKKKAPKTGPLKAFLLSDPVRGAHWLDVMPAQTITEFQELFPWLASMQKPGDEIQFDPAKLEKFRDDKTYRSYCNILNKGGPAVDPENPQVRYEKALKVYQDYRNKCYLHPKRHHVRQLHRLLKAERLLPNDQKTPEALLARVELCLGGKTLNPTGSLNRRNEFLREENNIPPKNN